jgi:hypothetical protein
MPHDSSSGLPGHDFEFEVKNFDNSVTPCTHLGPSLHFVTIAHSKGNVQAKCKARSKSKLFFAMCDNPEQATERNSASKHNVCLRWQ